MKSLLPAVALALGSLSLAHGEPRVFQTGEAPINLSFQPPVVASPGETIFVHGRIEGEAAVTVALRIDDGKSDGYASRVNDERKLPPGEFSFNAPLVGAKTSGGRLIDAHDIRRIILFRAAGEGIVRIDAFEIRAAVKLPAGAIGLSFGAADAPLIAGLERVTPGDKRMLAGKPVAVRRPGVDPVVANGVAGLERFHVDWPSGRALVSMWTEDIGEWENLPRALRRRIRVNGADVVDERFTLAEWLNRRYLAGRDREAPENADAWTEFGSRRGGLVSAEVDVGDDGITIELAGDSATATFLSALVVEPAGSGAARDFVESQRRAFITSAFPVARQAPDGVPPPIDLAGPGAPIAPVRVSLAPGSGVRVRIVVTSPMLIEHPHFIARPPALAGAALTMDVYAAQWRLTRVDVGGTLLARTARYLRGDPQSLALSPTLPRPLEFWISAPADAPPGVYRGALTVRLTKGDRDIPIEAEVLDVALPPEPSPAGFYLDEAPHLAWFPQTQGDRGRQISCDLDTLRHFGVVGNAPAMSTPTTAGLAAFVDDVRRAVAGGTRPPMFAYAPLKRLLAGASLDTASRELSAARRALADGGLPEPVWSVADEPANPDQGSDGINALIARLRHDAPGMRLGGQFNDPRDFKLAGAMDVALVDPGYNIDADRMAALRRRVPSVWLYNTGAPRFTAGVWLWRTGAARYIQWHARMPGADPYDPTDSREGDVQIFPPMPDVCAEHPDIHADLLDMAEGVVDQRWLAWLRSRREPAAAALLLRIAAETPTDWRTASRDGAAKAASIRKSIIDLARQLK